MKLNITLKLSDASDIWAFLQRRKTKEYLSFVAKSWKRWNLTNLEKSKLIGNHRTFLCYEKCPCSALDSYPWGDRGVIMVDRTWEESLLFSFGKIIEIVFCYQRTYRAERKVNQKGQKRISRLSINPSFCSSKSRYEPGKITLGTWTTSLGRRHGGFRLNHHSWLSLQAQERTLTTQDLVFGQMQTRNSHRIL